jgi:hypothetical protein
MANKGDVVYMLESIYDDGTFTAIFATRTYTRG